MSPLKAFFAVTAISLIAGGMTAAVTAQESVPTKLQAERLLDVHRMINGTI